MIKKSKMRKKTVGILVIGNVGVGKSSACNLIFGKDSCPVGFGKAVTRNPELKKKFKLENQKVKNKPIYIFDSEGFEQGSSIEKNIIDLLEYIKFIEDYHPIHFIWYCVSVAHGRFLKHDKEICEKLVSRAKIKLDVILTQVDKEPIHKADVYKREVIKALPKVADNIYFLSTINKNSYGCLSTYPRICPNKCSKSDPVELQNKADYYHCRHCNRKYSGCPGCDSPDIVFRKKKYSCDNCDRSWKNRTYQSQHKKLIIDALVRMELMKSKLIKDIKEERRALEKKISKSNLAKEKKKLKVQFEQRNRELQLRIDDIENVKKSWIETVDGKKNLKASLIIASASAVAAGIGLSPIPFSDFILLIPTQIGMVSSLAIVYRIPLTSDIEKILKNLFSKILLASVGITATFILGYGMAQLFKFIPVVGTGVGALINSGIAGTMTSVLGIGSAITFSMLYQKFVLQGKEVTNEEIEKELNKFDFASIITKLKNQSIEEILQEQIVAKETEKS